MRKTKMERGITLIALILTIVILLILAIVAINSITNDGILGKAEDAASEYNQSVKNEQSIFGKYDKFLDERINEKNEEKRNLNITYTQTEGTDLLESMVTFNITLAEEEWNPTLEQLRNIVAYMVDFSNFNEFKSFIEDCYSTDEEKVTYEELFVDEGKEIEFLNKGIEIGKKLLSFKDIAKLESLGIKVISVETPYGTTRYTTNLGGEVKCGFCKNGTYTFKIKSGGTVVTKDVTISNIKNYNQQAPYSVKLTLTSDAISDFGPTFDMKYAIDNSEIFENLEFNNSLNLEVNNKISYDLKTERLDTNESLNYVIKDDEYYKYFTSIEEWDMWFVDNKSITVASWTLSELGRSWTARQALLRMLLSEFTWPFRGWVDGEWCDYMDEYKLGAVFGDDVSAEESKEILSRYPQTNVGKRVSFAEGEKSNNLLLLSGEIEITEDSSIYIIVCED